MAIVSSLLFFLCVCFSPLEAGQKKLTRIDVEGPRNVKENSTAYYKCWAYFDDGSWEDVAYYATWKENSSYASFGNYGKLITSSVTENQWCRITASYKGFSDYLEITIANTTTPIVKIVISGPTEVNENSSAYYTCTAYYDDERSEDVSYSADWVENSWYAAISGSGKFATGSVDSDNWCRITATYRRVYAYFDVLIRDIKEPLGPVLRPF